MAEAGVGIACQNLTRQEVEEEPTGMYLWRVLTGNTHPSAPHWEILENDSGTGEESGLIREPFLGI